VVHTLAGYTVCTTFLSLFLHEPKKNWDQSLNGFPRAISHWRWSLRCEMFWEVHFFNLTQGYCCVSTDWLWCWKLLVNDMSNTLWLTDKKITWVLKVLTYIVNTITAHSISLAVILVIMSVLTFITTVILYLSCSCAMWAKIKYIDYQYLLYTVTDSTSHFTLTSQNEISLLT
jgi:hypothetical protein